MAGFDPSVISTIADDAPNPDQAKQNAYTLYDTKNKVELNSLNLSQAKEEQSDRLKVKGIAQSSDLSTDKGKNEFLEKAAKVSPDLAMKYQKDIANQKGMNLDNEMKKMKVAEEQVTPMINSIDSVLSDLQQRKDLYDKGQITKADLDGATQRQVLPKLMALKMEHPDLAPHLDQFLKNPENLTYSGLESVEKSTKDGRDRLKTRMDEINMALKQHSQDTKDANEASMEKERLSLEKHRLALESGERSKPEAGYEWKDPKDHSQGEVPVKGGSKDAEKPMTGREAQMFSRVLVSANLGTEALHNIMRLPAGASTGILGVGASPGGSILGAAKGVLQNNLSSHEVKTYNVMITGLSRNLSTLETQGLAPPGAFTQSLNANQLREGDNQMEKLRKMAESRQIIEFGLEPSLHNPRVAPEQQKEITGILDKLRKAIPFNHDDLTNLEEKQAKHPKTTLNDVMKSQGADKSTKAPEVGTVMDGYKFKGGNPADQSSWEKAK